MVRSCNQCQIRKGVGFNYSWTQALLGVRTNTVGKQEESKDDCLGTKFETEQEDEGSFIDFQIMTDLRHTKRMYCL